MYKSRYRRIIYFFARVIASITVWDLILPRIGFRRWSARGRPGRMVAYATRFRRLAIQLGGVMIKVGQFLSTRVDILPVEVTQELSGLQDEVPPVSFDSIRQVIESELGISLEEAYRKFNPTPLAAASLGQVHQAILFTRPSRQVQGRGNGHGPSNGLVNVVVKVQRPDIDKIIAIDLRALQTVGRWLQRYKPIRRRANVPALLNEFSRILYEEIDYLAEGRNAERFAQNFSSQGGVRVPKVDWSHTTTRVLTLEDVYAIKITDYNAITSAGISRPEVASRLLDTYLKQIFEDGFFHADPHPGNLFIEPLPMPVKESLPVPSGAASPPSNGHKSTTDSRWHLTFVDFGMVGHVPANLRSGLRELLIGVATRDSPRCVKAYQQMGILLPGADLDILEKAEARIFEQYWGKNMSELSNLSMQDFRQFATEFRELLYDLPFQVPQDLIFLARTVNILSGMCTGLDPQFNVFAHLAPYGEKIVAEEAKNNRDAWVTELQTLGRNWLSLPARLESLANKLEKGDISVRTPEINQQIKRLDRSVRQIGAGLIFSALLLGGIQLYINEENIAGIILLSGAVVSLIWFVITRLINGGSS